MEHCFIVASNNEGVLRSCLLKSPDLRQAEVNVQRDAMSAGCAYNRGIQSTKAEIMLFVHQDVFLPLGWLEQFEQSIKMLDCHDPNWGVAGLFGTQRAGGGKGFLYSTGLQRTVGEPFEGFGEVETLDEVMLVVRRSSGLRFDEQLPGFHLYGADICVSARQRGMKNYAVSAFCIHNSNGIGRLPGGFWKAYSYLWRKWFWQLPINTPCTRITRPGLPVVQHLVDALFSRNAKQPGRRVEDPALLYENLVERGSIRRFGRPGTMLSYQPLKESHDER